MFLKDINEKELHLPNTKIKMMHVVDEEDERKMTGDEVEDFMKKYNEMIKE